MGCSVPGCGGEHEGLGLCGKHFQRLKKRGSVEPTWPEGDRARFDAKVSVDENGCWLWTATLFLKTGYANFWCDGKSNLAHRVSYRWFVGPIPAGYQIDHLCKVRHCVNPAHLEAVTPVVNNIRSQSPSAVHGRKTHCIHGHEFTTENTYVPPKRPNRRYCRTCMANQAAARRRSN